MSTYGISNDLFLKAAQATYSLDPSSPENLGDGFAILSQLSTPTLKFYYSPGNPGKVLVGIRGTKKTDQNDIDADILIARGMLETSVRARRDIEQLQKAKSMIGTTIPFYGAGHSLGGALLDLFMKEGFFVGGRSYNGALEVGKEQEGNRRIYNAQDPLLSVFGPFLKQAPEIYKSDNLYNQAKDASGLGDLFKFTLGGPITYTIDTIRDNKVFSAHDIHKAQAGNSSYGDSLDQTPDPATVIPRSPENYDEGIKESGLGPMAGGSMHGGDSGLEYVPPPDAGKNVVAPAPPTDAPKTASDKWNVPETNLAVLTGDLVDYFGLGYDAAAAKFLVEHGNEQITSLVLRRAPVDWKLNAALNAITMGTWDGSRHRYGYDDIMHVSLIINGRYVTQRLSRVSITMKEPDYPRSEFMQVDGLGQGRTFTIQSLLDTTEKYVGRDVFFKYDTWTNNCQDYLLNILEANDLGKSPFVRGFLKQDVSDVLKEQPDYLQTVTGVLTNLGQIVGAGKKRGRTPQHMSRGDYYHAGLNRHFRYT